MARQRPVLFISCGQWAEKEWRLGKEICHLVEELRPDIEPYFAENQSNLQGLSDSILRALHRACGLICVMHSRGTVQPPDGEAITRGSVWVEQEIAVAAFMQHVLGRKIPVMYYKQRGVGIEGVRKFLHLNPSVEFTDEREVLADLRTALPSMVWQPFQDYALMPVVSYEKVTIQSDRHDYRLHAGIENVGKQKAQDFRLRVYFPRQFLKNIHVSEHRPDQRTPTQDCFEMDRKRAPDCLYPNDKVPNLLTIDYFVNHSIYHDQQAMASNIVVELDSGSMERVREEYPIAKFNQF